jgi:H+/gluconate symporter-like permease
VVAAVEAEAATVAAIKAATVVAAVEKDGKIISQLFYKELCILQGSFLLIIFENKKHLMVKSYF